MGGSEGWRTFDHTGDLGLEVWAGSPERLFALAAEALLAQVAQVAQVAESSGDATDVRRRLVLEGDDPPELFVHWLNSALLEADLAHAVWTHAHVERLERQTLEAVLQGPRRDPTRQTFLREVKAVSHHALSLDLTPGACRARVVLDL